MFITVNPDSSPWDPSKSREDKTDVIREVGFLLRYGGGG